MRSVLHRNRTVLFLSVLSTALFTSKVSAEAVSTTIQLAGPAATACVPPGTYISGHLHMTTRFTMTQNGMHVGQEINSAGTKIITPAGEFISNESHLHQTNVNFLKGATEYTIHDSFRYISKDTHESYRLDIKLHVTVNANGEVTAEVERVVIDCYVPCCGDE